MISGLQAQYGAARRFVVLCFFIMASLVVGCGGLEGDEYRVDELGLVMPDDFVLQPGGGGDETISVIDTFVSYRDPLHDVILLGQRAAPEVDVSLTDQLASLQPSLGGYASQDMTTVTLGCDSTDGEWRGAVHAFEMRQSREQTPYTVYMMMGLYERDDRQIIISMSTTHPDRRDEYRQMFGTVRCAG